MSANPAFMHNSDNDQEHDSNANLENRKSSLTAGSSGIRSGGGTGSYDLSKENGEDNVKRPEELNKRSTDFGHQNRAEKDVNKNLKNTDEKNDKGFGHDVHNKSYNDNISVEDPSTDDVIEQRGQENEAVTDTSPGLNKRCDSIESVNSESDRGIYYNVHPQEVSRASPTTDIDRELRTTPAKQPTFSSKLGDRDTEVVAMDSEPKSEPELHPGASEERSRLAADENDNTQGMVNGAQVTDSDRKRDEITATPEGDSELDSLQVPARNVDPEKGTDEPDAISVYSLFMERNVRYYFQHPYARLTIAYLITFCNFYMFAEDPIAHSYKEATMPVLGNCYCFIVRKYPPNAWSLLKVLMWVSAIILGCVVGKKVVHQYFFQRVLRLKMFAKDQGSWLTMAATTVLVVFVISWLYNLFLLAGGDGMKPYKIDETLGMSNALFTRIAAVGTWSGDFITAWIVTDVMLQEKLYPKWAVHPRRWWNVGFRRIIIFWVVTFSAFFIVLLVIATDWINWDTLNDPFVATNEASRSFLASFILVMDLLIVMQDWDFPHFINAMDIKLPGLPTANLKFRLPKFLRKEHWEVHITGKWMNYGIIVIVMFLDLNMWQTQMFYDPFKYAQYTGPDNKIYSVRDEASLTHNETMLNYEWRSTTIKPDTNQTYLAGDHVTNSQKKGYGLGVTCLAFIPCCVAFITFIYFIIYFGRDKPTKEDPHAGRLKKRKKTRFSLRNLGQRLSKRMRRNKTNSYSPEGARERTEVDGVAAASEV